MTFSDQEITADVRLEDDFKRLYEAKILNNQTTLRNLITGIDSPSREAMERTIAWVQTFALNCTAPEVPEYGRPSLRGAFGAGKTFTLASLHLPITYAATTGIVNAFTAALLPQETLALTAAGVAHASRINFRFLGGMTGSAALAALDFSRFRHDIGHIETFQASFSGKLASALRDVLNEREPTEETLKPLQALISIKVASLPPSRVSAEGMFNLFLTLLTVLVSYDVHRSRFSAEQLTDEALVSKQLNNLLCRMVEDSARLIPQRDDNTYYRVERPVNISVKPKPRTPQLGLLVPDQTVRLIERSHKWVAVEYFDQIHGVARQGWAPKKYFEPVAATAVQPARELSPAPIAFGLTEDERTAVTENWEQTNTRRIELIYKNAEGQLTNEERLELGRLQRLTDERIRLIAPLPISSMESVLANLERRT